MAGIAFRGDIYNDDRMFVLSVCRCTVSDGVDNTVATTVHHDGELQEHKWCVVTYRNIARYPAVRVDHFESEPDARAYVREIEPTVPLVSLDGRSPKVLLSYERFVEWKVANQLKEYNFREMYTPGGQNHQETILSPKRGRHTR